MPLLSQPQPAVPVQAPPAAPETQPRRPSPFTLLAALLVLLGGTYAVVQLWQRNAAPRQGAGVPAARIVTVKRGSIVKTARVQGVTRAKDFVNVIAPQLRMPDSNSQMILLKLAQSGSRVSRGQVVVEIDPQTLLDHIDDVKDGLKEKDVALVKKQVELELQSENARQQLRVAKGALDRARLDLRTLEVRSAIQQQLMQLAAEEAEAHYNQLRAEIPIRARAQAADLENVRIDQKLEAMHVNRHVSDVSKFTITSPVDGMVVLHTTVRRGGDQVTVAQGDAIRPGQPIMQIVDTSSMIVDATINQASSSRYKIGQKAAVGLDAYPGAKFDAHIIAIGALATMPGRREQFYIREVPLKLQLTGVDSRVIPDLTAYADIETARADEVLVAPLSAVSREQDKAYIFVAEDNGRFERREVKLGLDNGIEVEVVDGLDEGERVRAN